ncbi:YbhB/YbcL family Raf kinase inhibitor-like protein [Leucobacter denitrificans]|uniref:YbhB/YbcL family Raf kinase inhibitor-like protein n=1 Tax=Leucobacter denitrificans TaxID=683042 RepID=A0A7G9S388_9MICO|nr:YbhB/YbcL family Raf kinase inhibitor-like protein [Leucobacter denitrificans]QNN62313.1 YbhB/YbcL family Raf kinase inhibitor-like protein [Leucobacter denitrificans]
MGLNIQDLAISSPDIASLGAIDDAFAAETGNQVPRLEISGVPAEAVELAVILHDPDAPLPQGFTHWTVYGIDPQSADVTSGRVGPNGIGEASYSGPQPPHGHGQHHYYFWVYALSRKVEGEPSREEFLANYADAIVEQNRLVGTYQR